MNQNQSYRSRWELQLCSWWLFHLKLLDVPTVWLKFWRFEIQIYQTTTDGKTINIKVVDLDQNNNFVVDNFFIWSRLGF